MSSSKKPKELSRLRMAEVVLDALLSVLVDKGVVTRADIQKQVLDKAQADSKTD